MACTFGNVLHKGTQLYEARISIGSLDMVGRFSHSSRILYYSRRWQSAAHLEKQGASDLGRPRYDDDPSDYRHLVRFLSVEDVVYMSDDLCVFRRIC